MLCKALIQPDLVWEFYIKNEKKLEKEAVQVAGSASGFYQIYITIDDGTPCFEVYEMEKDVMAERIYFVTDKDAKNAAVTVYDKYFVEYTNDEDDKDEVIREREAELIQALKAFVEVASDGDMLFSEVFKTDEDAESALDFILEYLAYDNGLVVYRPSIIECGEEQEVYTEYPYEEYDMR